MRLAFGMRTANRAPKRNYLRPTLLAFQRAGGQLAELHLAVTAPEPGWLEREGSGLQTITHWPLERRGANENALAALEGALQAQPDMICLLEDDLQFCADFPNSLGRWLDDYARRDRHLYRCFGFTTPPHPKLHAYDWPMAGLRASQTIILWADEAHDLLTWGRRHLTDWVPLAPWGRKYPHVTDPTVAFDKFVATWALLRWPGTKCVMTHPYFVDHIGDDSTLHRFGGMNHRPFAGRDWAYHSA